MNPVFSIELQDIGKKYNRNWLFKELNLTLSTHDKLALVGTNGSGKSTLLKIIAAQTSPSRGRMRYKLDNKPVSLDKVYQHISWMGPYIELFPELSLLELYQLHFRFNKPLHTSVEEIIQLLNLEADKHKLLRYYSSGMLQRAKIGMALFTQSKTLLLDEPTSNMDTKNAELMLSLIDQFLGDRIFILASNMEREYNSFAQILKLGKA